MVFAAVPTMVKTLLARADSSFYRWDAVQAYESVQGEAELRSNQ